MADRERARLAPSEAAAWRRWGPYLSERAWGTVREDYSSDGDAWRYFPHEHARSRTYRWSEDGLAGLSDESQFLCLAVALWNERDPYLKERLFGLTGPQGNHGEDAKEYWWYVDATPSHSLLVWRYHYPQTAFPYDRLVAESLARGRADPEFELADTGCFDDDRYWQVTVTYAKASANDIVARLEATNCGPGPAVLHVLPTLWFRNTWAWGRDPRPSSIAAVGQSAVRASHGWLGDYVLSGHGGPTPLFCDNETNMERVFGVAGPSRYSKDGINDHVVSGAATVNPANVGSKAALWYRLSAAGGETVTATWRLSEVGADRPGTAGRPDSAERSDSSDSSDGADGADGGLTAVPPGAPGPVATPDEVRDAIPDEIPNASPSAVAAVIAARTAEADAFYGALAPAGQSPVDAHIMRRAFAGLVWSKQFYHYDVDHWLEGDPAQPVPPEARRRGRNAGWRHLNNRDVLLMPDKWEYPWYASWDLAFQCVALAHIDPGFAKDQLLLFCREWFMHPNGQLPAYEWAFSDANPPLHAWAALAVYRLDGSRDRTFLARLFHKLVINFTWWVNRKDAEGNNVFEGGFLGLDNVGPLDRSKIPPHWGTLEQSDGTAWMALYCLNLLEMALILAREDATYTDMATKFFEHFCYIATALNRQGLWDDADGFYYDVLRMGDGRTTPLKVRSVVGLIPLCAVLELSEDTLAALGTFRANVEWFVANKPEYAEVASYLVDGERRLLSIVGPDRLARIVGRLADPEEFLSPFGVRSLSRAHRDAPFHLDIDGMVASVGYEPAESTNGLFGGNSNWRGPVWFPVNHLLIDALRRHGAHYGTAMTVEYPRGSGNDVALGTVAEDIAQRLISLFRPGGDGRRPAFGWVERFQHDPRWRDELLFFEYFHGENGAGLGAMHQTGWTALVVDLLLGSQTLGGPP